MTENIARKSAETASEATDQPVAPVRERVRLVPRKQPSQEKESRQQDAHETPIRGEASSKESKPKPDTVKVVDQKCSVSNQNARLGSEATADEQIEPPADKGSPEDGQPPRRNKYEMLLNGEITDEDLFPKEKVGYGKPPKHSQFKPGKSGNPFGRPKGGVNLRTALEKIFTDKISVRIDGKLKKVTRLEAAFMQHMNKAVQGDHKSMQVACNTAQTLGLLKERAKQLVFGNLRALSHDELVTFERLFIKAAGIIEDK